MTEFNVLQSTQEEKQKWFEENKDPPPINKFLILQAKINLVMSLGAEQNFNQLITAYESIWTQKKNPDLTQESKYKYFIHLENILKYIVKNGKFPPQNVPHDKS